MPDENNGIIKLDPEIEAALQEFEVKANADQVPVPPTVAKVAELPGMIKFVIKYSGGAIADQRQAEYVLLGFAALTFGAALFVFFKGNTPPSTSEPLPGYRIVSPGNVPPYLEPIK